MVKEEIARIANVNERVAPRGNECKCIEIPIIILSRRIVCPIAYTGDTPGIRVDGDACARKRIKGWDEGRLCYFLSATLVHRLRCRPIVYPFARPPLPASCPSSICPFFLSNLSAALTVISAGCRVALLAKQREPLLEPE